MKVVIIEDELLTAKDLEKTIRLVEPNVSIVCVLQTVEAAIRFFQSKPEIDLIFSDIQLGDGISFDIFNSVEMTIPIVFCTAFNEYALQAFTISGIDYVLKPFSKTAIEKAITKFKNITNVKSTPINFQEIYASIIKQLQPNKLPNVLVNQADKIIPISGDDIALFYIDHGIVKTLSFDKKIWIISQKLDELEQKFAPAFFRANRQYLVSRNVIKEAQQHFNRKLLLKLNIPHNEPILVGKEKVTSFLEWLASN